MDYVIEIALPYVISGKVDISDLTWEQKERVLRYLFARMNGSAKPKTISSAPTLPAIGLKEHRLSLTQDDSNLPKGEDVDKTFLTQAKVDVPDTSELAMGNAWKELHGVTT